MNDQKGYFCRICNNNIDLYNKDLTFSWDMHNQEKEHLTAKKLRLHNKNDRHNLLPNNTIFESTASILQNACELEKSALALMEVNHSLISSHIQDVFQQFYLDQFKVVLFGSRITGLTAKTDADLDFFIDTSDAKHPIDNEDPAKKIMMRVEQDIKQNRYATWSNVVFVSSARTPILRLFHIPSSLFCDVTIMGGYGIYNTKLMIMYLNNVPLLRQLILLVREWARENDFQSELKSYAFSLLVVFYLQSKRYVPSVDDLTFEYKEQVHQKIRMIGGYECIEYDKINYDLMAHNVPRGHTVKRLLHEFFQFYAEFNFENHVVCPLLGRPIPKKWFTERGERLPPELNTYVARIKADPFASRFNVCNGINLQDPIDLDHNLTRETKETHMRDFVRSCNSMDKTLAGLL